jgi:prepilin-type N-terminal cleavage/methylation domain-containing protein
MRSTRRQSGFSLIEMIVVLAIIAIVLTTIAISFVKRMDRQASERETANLKKMAAAFKRSVEVNRYIPDATTWAATVAAQLGWQASAVSANERQISRALLIDPYMQVGSASVGGPNLPYSQPNTGSTVTNGSGAVLPPQNPRFMIVSTIGSPLPSGIVSGVGATNGANAFNNIWVTPAGAVPTGWTFGNANDLKIARIDLSDLFILMTLWNTDATRTPFYGVDALSTNSVLSGGGPKFMYFLRGTELKLYGATGTDDLQYAEVVFTRHDFSFELGGWTAQSSLGRSVGTPYGKDMQLALDLFLRAPVNQYATGSATRSGVQDAMVNYMNAFIAWRDKPGAAYEGEGCPGPVANNTNTVALGAARAALNTITGNLITPR